MPERDTMPEEIYKPFDECCFVHRETLRGVAEAVKFLMNHPTFVGRPGDPRENEMRANIMLAYRHIEDATMRLGKAVQASDGGKSVYPR